MSLPHDEEASVLSMYVDVITEYGEIVASLNEKIRMLEANIERYQTALHQIESWSQAYPLTVFPEPNLKKAGELLKAGGITLDAVSASAMRRVVEGVGKIAAGALHYECTGRDAVKAKQPITP